MEWDVVVIGAGAAGLLAAARAAERGLRTLLLEKNSRPGVKILMSGGTRCNITQHTDNRGIVEAFGTQGRFLHSALAAMSPSQLVQWIESEGVPTKVEETGKVFPVSNQASDVLGALLSRLHRSGCQLALGEPLSHLEKTDSGFRLVTPTRAFETAHLILTTGGQSYPGSGTTGDGYAFARRLGHSIVTPRPSLVPITTHAEWVGALKGVTVPDVSVRIVQPPNSAELASKTPVLAARRGSFLFTHFGLSGPVVLDVSRVVSGYADPRQLTMVCDFLPARTEAELEALFKEHATKLGKRQLSALLPETIPRRLAEALIQLAGLPAEQKIAELNKGGRARLLSAVKRLPIPLTGTLGFKKAEVTAGGVCLDEVDSRSMQSKLHAGLQIAGELLDLDGPIGGYNFQAAFSTGFLAGSCCGR